MRSPWPEGLLEAEVEAEGKGTSGAWSPPPKPHCMRQKWRGKVFSRKGEWGGGGTGLLQSLSDNLSTPGERPLTSQGFFKRFSSTHFPYPAMGQAGLKQMSIKESQNKLTLTDNSSGNFRNAWPPCLKTWMAKGISSGAPPKNAKRVQFDIDVDVDKEADADKDADVEIDGDKDADLDACGDADVDNSDDPQATQCQAFNK